MSRRRRAAPRRGSRLRRPRMEDGSTKDANRRWPDVLAERLQNQSDGFRRTRRPERRHHRQSARSTTALDRLATHSGRSSVRPGSEPRSIPDVLAQSGVKFVLALFSASTTSCLPSFPFTPLTKSVNDMGTSSPAIVSSSHARARRPFVSDHDNDPSVRGRDVHGRRAERCLLAHRKENANGLAASSTPWSISTRCCWIRPGRRDSFPLMTPKTICMSTMTETPKRGTPFLSPCSSAIEHRGRHTHGQLRSGCAVLYPPPRMKDHRPFLWWHCCGLATVSALGFAACGVAAARNTVAIHQSPRQR